MDLKKLLLLLTFVSLPTIVDAQTTVNLTVQDTASVLWNGPWSVVLRPPPGYPPGTIMTIVQGGGSTSSQNGTLVSGAATIILPGNGNMVPVGSLWYFTVCFSTTGNCFSQLVNVATSSPQALTITPPAPGAPVSSGGSGIASVASLPGNGYYLSTSACPASTTQCVQVNADWQFNANCSWTNTVATVTCPSGTFTQADVGKRGFGTNGANFTGFQTGVCQIGCLATTTITSVTGSTIATFSVAATGTSIANPPFFWGTNPAGVGGDDALLNTLATTLAANCGTLTFPSMNANNKPFIIAIISSKFTAALNTNCVQQAGTSAMAEGLLLRSAGVSAATVLWLPEFDPTTCNASQSQCWGPSATATGPGNVVYRDLHLTGGGISNCGAGFNSKVLIELPGQNSGMYNFNASGLCGNQGAGATFVIGLQMGSATATGPIRLDNVVMDGFGSIPCVAAHTAYVTITNNSFCGDSAGPGLWVQNVTGSGVVSMGNIYGPTTAYATMSGYSGCAVIVDANAFMRSIGDITNQQGGAGECEYGVSGTLEMDHVDATSNGTTNDSVQISNGAAGLIIASDSIFKASAASSVPIFIGTGGGKFISKGGNRITAPAGGTAVSIAAAGTYTANPTDTVVGIASNSGTIFGGLKGLCSNTTPITVTANVATDQLLMACTIPANTFWYAGQTLRITLAGVYSTPAASSTAVVVKAKLGALTVATWTSTALGGIQATNDQFNIIGAPLTVTTAGSSGAFEAHGDLIIDLGIGNTVADSIFADVNTATVGTVDLTAAQTLQITIAFTVASASNSATQRQLLVETVN